MFGGWGGVGVGFDVVWVGGDESGRRLGGDEFVRR
jgi:hypothetical protein